MGSLAGKKWVKFVAMQQDSATLIYVKFDERHSAGDIIHGRPPI